MSLLFKRNLPASQANNSRIPRIKKVKFSGYCFFYEPKHIWRFSNLHLFTFNKFNTFLVGINMFKVNKKNIEIYLKLTIKTLEWCHFSISVFNSQHISHLVLVLLNLTLNKQMLVGVITGWQLATLLKLALIFRYFLGFLMRVMVLKLRSKSHKCLVLNLLGFFSCPPHMISLPLNTASFTINA